MFSVLKVVDVKESCTNSLVSSFGLQDSL